MTNDNIIVPAGTTFIVQTPPLRIEFIKMCGVAAVAPQTKPTLYPDAGDHPLKFTGDHNHFDDGEAGAACAA